MQLQLGVELRLALGCRRIAPRLLAGPSFDFACDARGLDRGALAGESLDVDELELVERSDDRGVAHVAKTARAGTGCRRRRSAFGCTDRRNSQDRLRRRLRPQRPRIIQGRWPPG